VEREANDAKNYILAPGFHNPAAGMFKRGTVLSVLARLTSLEQSLWLGSHKEQEMAGRDAPALVLRHNQPGTSVQLILWCVLLPLGEYDKTGDIGVKVFARTGRIVY
jgi:hypothetical protein